MLAATEVKNKYWQTPSKRKSSVVCSLLMLFVPDRWWKVKYWHLNLDWTLLPFKLIVAAKPDWTLFLLNRPVLILPLYWFLIVKLLLLWILSACIQTTSSTISVLRQQCCAGTMILEFNSKSNLKFLASCEFERQWKSISCDLCKHSVDFFRFWCKFADWTIITFLTP